MRRIFIVAILGSLPWLAQSQESQHFIQCAQSQQVAMVPNGGDCGSPEYITYQAWSGADQDLRAILSHDGDPLSLWVNAELDASWQLVWHFDRLTGPNLPDHSEQMGSSVDTALTKFGSGSLALWEKYLVSIYIDNGQDQVLMDWVHVHVMDGAKGQVAPLHYGFDLDNLSLTAPLDDWGRSKVTAGPLFSGNGNRRSDLNLPAEKMLNRCFYPAFGMVNNTLKPGASSRAGDGYMRLMNPAVSTVAGLEQPYAAVCEDYNPYTYDFCGDPCGAFSQAVPYDDFQNHDASTCSNVEVNLHPTHLTGEEAFYAFSFRIPLGFVESEMVGPEGELGHNRREVIAEFIQPNWPVEGDAVGYPCSPSMQVIYLGEGMMGVQYGIKGYNGCAFGPWPCPKGEWVDLAFHVKWAMMTEDAPTDANGTGLFEVWINTGEGYVKQCLKPATEYFQAKRDFGEGEDALAPFIPSSDQATVFGPNMVTPNPAFLSLKSKRAVAYEGACGLNFTNSVDFDELRIGATLTDVTLPGTLIKEGIGPCDSESHAQTRNFEFDLNDEVQVYPNPVEDGMVTVSWSHDWLPATLEIVDLMGRTVVVHELGLDAGSKKLIDLQSLTTGSYVVRLSTLNRVQTETLVIR